MTREELREAVWKALMASSTNTEAADAAIAIVVEEMAKVCEEIEDRLTTQWKAGYKICDYTQGASDGANDCVAAIRAYGRKPDGAG